MKHYNLKPPGRQTEADEGQALTQDEAMERHTKLIHAFIQRQGGGDIVYEEALQAGRIGLWRAIKGYDPSRGFTFSTYAWVAIQRAIHQAVEAAWSPPTLGMEALSDQGYILDLDEEMDQALIMEALYDQVAHLPPRLRRIIEGRYGLTGKRVYGLKELGAELGLSAERVRQLQQEALARLRHPANSVEVRSLMGRNNVQDYRRALSQNAAWLRKRSGRS
jgi:RNA polymerase sigma factor (sigma-70 family)